MSKRAKLSTIRIIGGQFRGRRLPVPDEKGLRPTIDRVRETLFNWLMHDLTGVRCLDLFAGTGVLGLESLSRGASFVQFIESNAVASGYLKDNITHLLDEQLQTQQAEVAHADALKFLVNPSIQSYDIVFLDPPFKSDLLDKSIELLMANNWLADGAMVYLEQDVNHDVPQIPSSWQLHRHGKAGQSAYYLYIS